jgi:pyruvate/2-oxoglutarate dehydrogenase complex dihydrolipoamide acyltransferase (E2) component
MNRSAAAVSVLVALLALPACSTKAATSPADGAPAAPPDASAAPARDTPDTRDTRDTPAAGAAPGADAGAPAPQASSASAPLPPDPPPPAPEAPLPKVAVANIGMHIGGGPNDDVTKDPIRKSVAPHFDELKRCFARAEDPAKGGDFGVDLRIERAGGTAQVSHPRTTIKGKDFRACVVHVFETIDFQKPRGGKTTVSYSLRFTPGPKAKENP